MFSWTLLVVGILGAEAEPPSLRSVVLHSPMLLWEHGTANVWSTHAEGRQPEPGPVLGSPLGGRDTTRTLSVALTDGAFVVLGTLDGELHKLSGPQTIMFAADERGDDGVRMTFDGPSDPRGYRVANLGDRFATGRFGRAGIVRSPASGSLEGDGAALVLMTPRSRALRLRMHEPLVITWNAAEGDARRFDLDIAEIGGDGNVLATVERWWRVRGPSFRTWRPLPPGRRFRIAVEDATKRTPSGHERAEIAVETISDEDGTQLDRVLSDLQAMKDTFGIEAVTVFQAIVLSSFGLDGEAATRWTHLFAMHPTHPRAPEIAAHALAVLP